MPTNNVDFSRLPIGQQVNPTPAQAQANQLVLLLSGSMGFVHDAAVKGEAQRLAIELGGDHHCMETMTPVAMTMYLLALYIRRHP